MSRVTDQQVRQLREEMTKLGSVEIAALRVGMHRNTARKYLKMGQFPSDLKRARTWDTRPDPFAADWPELEARLKLAPTLQARALFEHLMLLRPGVYDEGQLRTFQRRVKVWRAHHGPDKEVFFRQEHVPGEAMQTDFTWATELAVTILGQPFPHMLCHVVLPYSNWDWITVSRSESMLALRRGVPAALVQLGRVPRFHQTDNSTAATHVRAAEDEPEEDAGGKPATHRTRAFNADYVEMNKHYGMTPRTIGIGKSEQNGDVEASNGALKSRLNQHLLLRENRDFPSVEAWEGWAQDICRSHNKRRRPRVAAELAPGDAAPRGAIIFLVARRAGGRHDVEQVGELAPEPCARIVLIRNRVHAQLRNELPDFGHGPRCPHVPQRLGQGVRAAPNRDPDRAVVGAVNGLD